MNPVNEVVAAVRRRLAEGGRITFPPGLGEASIMPMLAEGLPDRDGVELLVPFRTSSAPLMPPPRVRTRAHFGGGTMCVDRPDYVPARYGRLLKAMRPGGPLAIDVAVLRVSPCDATGRHSVGPSATMTAPLARRAAFVVAEIDPELPRTDGPGSTVATEHIDIFVDAVAPLELPEPRPPVPATTASAVASIIDQLVPDDVTVQVGLGRNAQAVIGALANRTSLRLVAGLFSPELADLIQNGHVDANDGVSAGEAIGPVSLMEYIHENPRIVFRTSEDIHHPGWLARHERFVTINSVLSMDLLGRASTEYVGGRVVGGLGGLPDFLEGASLSPEGFNILVVPTDPRTGRVRLVDCLPTEDVSVLSHHVDYAVTEHGVADLRDVTGREARERLLAVADEETVRTLERRP